jgi:excisionase family DNA binding protein
VNEAAEVLGISAKAVRSRIKRGTLESVKDGNTVYILLSSDQTNFGQDIETR